MSSLDGMVAKTDNRVSWFDTSDPYDKGVAGGDPATLLQAIDRYVMGSHTYENAMELSKSYGRPYGDKPTMVLTRRVLSNNRPNVECYAGDLNHSVAKRLKPQYRNVWLVGGAMLAREFIRLQMADESAFLSCPLFPAKDRGCSTSSGTKTRCI